MPKWQYNNMNPKWPVNIVIHTLFLNLFYIHLLNTLSAEQDKNVQFINQLRRSLSYGNEPMSDVEKEKKLVSQMETDINFNEDKSGFLDYSVVDMWWTSTIPKLRTQATATQQTSLSTTTPAAKPASMDSKDLVSEKPQMYQADFQNNDFIQRDNLPNLDLISAIVSNWVFIMATTGMTASPTQRQFPTIVTTVAPNLKDSDILVTTKPSKETTTLVTLIVTEKHIPSGVPPGWPFSPVTIAVDPFVYELKETMEKYKYGYFTTSVLKYLELLTTKIKPVAVEILETTGIVMTRTLESNKTNALGARLKDHLIAYLNRIKHISSEQLIRDAKVPYEALKNKTARLSPKANEAIDYYDSMFTKEEGEKLFDALKNIQYFPKGDKPALEMCQDTLDGMLQPFIREKGKKSQKKLISLINHAIREVDPYWRAEYSSENIPQHNNSTDNLPKRRMQEKHEYKEIMEHFFLKHPSLFSKFISHYENRRKHKHHHRSHRRHNHKKHEEKVHFTTHVKYDRGYEQTTKKRTRKNNKIYIDSSNSESYFLEPALKVIQIKTNTKLQILTKQPPTTGVNESSEETKSKNFKTALSRRPIHKIREVSSYSDDEEYLRTKIYDALRQGNRTFVNFRALDSDNETGV